MSPRPCMFSRFTPEGIRASQEQFEWQNPRDRRITGVMHEYADSAYSSPVRILVCYGTKPQGDGAIWYDLEELKETS